MNASSLARSALGYATYGTMRAVLAAATVGDPDATIAAAAQMGRAFARSPLNRKRLDRAADNLKEAFPDWTEERRRAHAVHGYEHLAMLGVEIAGTNRIMNQDGWPERARLHDISKALDKLLTGKSVILVTGHVGNWELTGQLIAMLQFKVHALYRPLDLRPLDAWLQQSRSRRGLYLVDKFGAAKRLPGIIDRGECPAFVADQNAGDRGLFVPFFGRLASTYKAIGLTAARYGIPVVVGWCKRVGGEVVGPAGEGAKVRPRALRFDLHVADAFGPEDWESQPDPVFYIAARYRRALEDAIREAPEQTLWMHRFWKSRPRHEREGKPFPKALVQKLSELPWMTDGELGRIIARSERDAAEWAQGPQKVRGLGKEKRKDEQGDEIGFEG
ncbi:MAG: lysophospholipid acyltransferase family protein [Phycisphaeraceae bacterium]|nr:lysophospholipid acyltransferase family protein [Phycisphaeraceae bacterium]